MRRLVMLLIASAALLAPGAASAAFMPPTDVAGGSAPQVAAAADGSAILTYVSGGNVMLATKQPGAFFNPAKVLGTGYNVALATAPSGQAIVAWTQANGTVRAALRPVGGGDFSVVTASIGTALGSGSPPQPPIEASIAASGRAYVAFASATKANLTTFAAGSTTPVATTAIATPNAATGLAIAPVTGADGAYLVATVTYGLGNRVYAKRWSSSLGSGAQLTLASATGENTSGTGYGHVLYYEAFAPLAVTGTHASVFWVATTYDSEEASFNTTLTGTLMRADEPFTAAPVAVDTDSGQQFDRSGISAPISATDASGAVTVAWAQTGYGKAIQQIVRPTPAAAFGAVTPLTNLTSLLDDVTVTGVGVASIGGGATQLTYATNSTTASTIFTAPATSTGLLPQAEPTILASPVGTDDFVQPVASGTGTGDTVVAWIRQAYSPLATTLQVALSDVTPPTLEINDAATTQATADTVDGSNPAAVEAAQTFTLSATASDLWTPTTVTWDFGDGTTATGSSVTHRFTAAGTFTITATATDAAGNRTTRTTSRKVPAVVAPAATPPPVATPGPAATPVATPAPVIASALKLSRTKFSAVRGKGKPSKSAGATATFTLSAAVPRVEIAVRRLVQGYRSGTSCAVKSATKKAKRCTTSLAVGFAGTPAGVAGKNTFALTGKAGGKTLKPGKYTLTVAPVNALQSHGTNPISATFTITA